jgi:hypothetical protein
MATSCPISAGTRPGAPENTTSRPEGQLVACGGEGAALTAAPATSAMLAVCVVPFQELLSRTASIDARSAPVADAAADLGLDLHDVLHELRVSAIAAPPVRGCDQAVRHDGNG